MIRRADIEGRTVVRLDAGRYWDASRQTWIYRPRLTLDNGRVLTFMVQETEEGAEDYGVELLLLDRPKRSHEIEEEEDPNSQAAALAMAARHAYKGS